MLASGQLTEEMRKDRDLAGPCLDPSKLEEWLDHRRVHYKAWGRGVLQGAKAEIKKHTAQWTCDLQQSLHGRRGAKTPRVKRTLHVVRARICHALEEQVMIWRPPF